MVARQQLVKRLGKWAAELHHHISKQKEELSLQYVSQVEVDDQTTEEEAVAQLRRLYSENEEREIEHGTSLIIRSAMTSTSSSTVKTCNASVPKANSGPPLWPLN